MSGSKIFLIVAAVVVVIVAILGFSVAGTGDSARPASVSGTTVRMAKPVGIRTNGLTCPGFNPSSARRSSGRSDDTATRPSHPPLSAEGSIDNDLASTAKSAPLVRRWTTCAASSADPTTIIRTVT